MSNRLSLKISRAGEDLGVENFDRDIIKIGRLASAHLKLDDPKVSRIHAVIEDLGGALHSIDEVEVRSPGAAD